MTKDEKESLYQEFRARFIDEMASRLMYDYGPARAFGQLMMKWSHEIILAKALQQNANAEKKTSTEARLTDPDWMPCCICHRTMVNVATGFDTCADCLAME